MNFSIYNILEIFYYLCWSSLCGNLRSESVLRLIHRVKESASFVLHYLSVSVMGIE